MTQFYGKTKICYGQDALETLEHLPVRQAFLVTDAIMVKAGFCDQVKTHLTRGGIACSLFDGVEPDPGLETVTEGALRFLRSGSDLIVALGGGSAIDTAKAIAYFALKTDESKAKALLAAIPTTSGTGSEVTAIAVVTDKVNGVKIPLNDEALIPDLAILDARFTRTVPPPVTAATGMDVLTHAIEAYTCRQANPFTSLYATSAIDHVFRYLFRCYQRMDDMEAREMMLLASCMAGMAFNNSGLGLTHSIAHSLGGLFHIPHGLANAVVLPHVLHFNSFDVGHKYREIAAMLDLPHTTPEEGAQALIQAVREKNASMGIPDRVSALKTDEALFRTHQDSMIANILEDMCTAGNPRRPSRDDIKQLLERVW